MANLDKNVEEEILAIVEKYQKENIASLACRVKKEQAEKFKAYCAEHGKTSNAVLRDFVYKCIGEEEAGE